MEKETENNNESPSTSNESKVEESPKPLAFTIDFGEGKSVDTQRHKALVEKYQNRHRRGQSLSKIDEPSTQKKNANVSSLTRKSSTQSEGYYSSDERGEKVRTSRASPHSMTKSKGDLTLPLKNILNDKMTQSFPNVKFNLSTIRSPDIELKDISSPELDPISPFSPKAKVVLKQMSSPNPTVERIKITRQHSSPECKPQKNASSEFIDGSEFDFDKSDSVSDAGTYTVDNDNYTEEQKARMSIDKEFNIEQVSVMKKTEEYVRNLASMDEDTDKNSRPQKLDVEPIATKLYNKNVDRLLPSPKSPSVPTSPLAINQSYKTFIYKTCNENREPKTKLSPILSPTQNLSITEGKIEAGIENTDIDDALNQTYTKIMFPSPKSKTGIGLLEDIADQGSFTSVTSSGAFSRKGEAQVKGHHRQPSLTKSEIHVETYTSSNSRGQSGDNIIHATISLNHKESTSNNNIMENKVPNISKLSAERQNDDFADYDLVNATLTLGKINNLPPAIGGKTSPTKIPSPVHTARPRSRNSISSANIDLSDSSLETESYLKPTQSIINSLQKKLSLDSDQESDFDSKCNIRLNNNTRNLLKQKSKHIRHNSFDDRNLTFSNKLEHFQNKNLQSIDQTFGNKLQNRAVIKVQNSPNNSPLRRSSSFSNKNKVPPQPKVSNLTKDINLKNSPSLTRNSSIQRSASTANIRPNILQSRRSSAGSEHEKIDRNQFGDTESSSEEDFDKNLLKKKDLSNLTNTRYNRAFSLRRARLDTEPSPSQKCPNTPEMRRKFQTNDHLRMERAISVDRRPVKTNDVQSRYLQNITRNKSATPPKIEISKNVPKYQHITANVNKPQVFARTDSGRFSMRSTKSSIPGFPKNQRKDQTNKKQSGGRSNSTLSSREVEFQNWKRRKSYDPMKAAAEGKKKAEMAKKQAQNIMVQSYIESSQDCDSSPSHSSSVHRSQM
ncbi:uncharacterized protein LOC108736313 isoform X2 [Agrilus planipennis]|uniref:Uncharacterized protein LOC108736313 isoform X2 n=1 Tax=Agrilus planipennis TaxID=224129 RepID=A0A1W4WJS6_AGRPL|nr:uncharacterized protein LOC108736313 isoform X2 [Agrilus planipennis]